MTVYSNIQFVKSGQKNWAGLSPPPPLIWKKSNRTATFFLKPSHRRDILLSLYWLIVKHTVFVCLSGLAGGLVAVDVFACLLAYTEKEYILS